MFLTGSVRNQRTARPSGRPAGSPSQSDGISTEDAEAFLTGSDEETLAKQAARLAALAGTRPGTPKPDLTQGMQGTPTQKTTADMFADFFHSNMN